MSAFRMMGMALLACGAMGIAACNADADIDTDADSVAVGGDTATVPGASVDVSADTNTAADTGVGGDIAQGTAETRVEAKLVMEPGYSSVEVDSGPDGAIILSGTVATQAEKDSAEAIAKATEGVMSVTNNIMVK